MIAKRSLDCNIKSEDKVKELSLVERVAPGSADSLVRSGHSANADKTVRAPRLRYDQTKNLVNCLITKKEQGFVSEALFLRHAFVHAELEVFSEDFDFRIVVHLVGCVATAIETDIATLDAIDGEGTALIVFHVFLFLACAKLG